MKELPASHLVETVLTLGLVYVMLALFCSTVNEWIAVLLRSRAAVLRAALDGLWQGSPLAAAFYAHPLVTTFIQPRSSAAWLPAHIFSRALIDLLISAAPGPVCSRDLLKAIEDLPSGSLRTALLALLRGGNGDAQDIETARRTLETWFEDAMVCATARYKRQVHRTMLILAALSAAALNADTLAILHRLNESPAGPLPGWLSRLAGWLLTAAAVSLGAPFWFDVLNRMVRLQPKPRPRESRAA